MKKIQFILVITLFIIQGHSVFSKDVNAGHFLYMAKKIFPETSDVTVFISKEAMQTQQPLLERASAQHQLKTSVFLIGNSMDVGKNIKKLKKNSILIIIDSDLLMKKSTQLYILKNCKEKQISLFTPSRGYSDLGALLGVIQSNENQVELVVNLKHNDHLKSNFNDEFLQKVGITDVIQ